MFTLEPCNYHLVYWNGTRYVNREVLIVKANYLPYIHLRTAVPGPYSVPSVTFSTTNLVYGVDLFWDVVTKEMFYASNRAVLTRDIWLKTPDYGLEYPLEVMLKTSHKLFDLAQETAKKRQALKKEFAKLCDTRLPRDMIDHIIFFC